MALTVIIIVFLVLMYLVVSDRENGYRHFAWLVGGRGGMAYSEMFYFLYGLDAAADSPCKIILTEGQLLLTVMENTYKIARGQLKGAYVFGENTIIKNGSSDSGNLDKSDIDFKHLSEVICDLNGAGIKKNKDEKHYMVISYNSSSGDLKTVMFAPVKQDNMSMGPLFAFAGRINKTYELNTEKPVTVQTPPDDYIQL